MQQDKSGAGNAGNAGNEKSGRLSGLIQDAVGITAPPDFRYAYELRPANFDILTNEKKMRLMRNWWSFLRYLEHETKITLTYTMMRLPDAIAEQRLRERHEREEDEDGYDVVPVLRILLASTVPLDEDLQRADFPFYPRTAAAYPQAFPPATSERAGSFRYTYNEKDFWGRVYSLTTVPRLTRPAWVFGLLDVFQRIEIRLYPLENDVAMKKIKARRLLFTDTRVRRDEAQKLEALKMMENQIVESQGFAMEWSVTGFLLAGSKQELSDMSARARKFMRANGIVMQSSWFQQRNILDGRAGARYLSDTLSTGILYPLASAELIEPTGVYLGTNMATGSPIFFDIMTRQNRNVFTAGQSGGGKSFTNKILLKRFTEQNPGTMCIVIDPQGEYLPHADYFGLDSIEIKPGNEYGLDPFKIYETQTEAVDIIGIATDAPEMVRKQWAAIAEECNSIDDLYEKYEPGRQYLSDFVQGPVARMFRGEPKFSNKMIISLSALDGHRFQGMFILMILVYAWKVVNALPDVQWKFLLVDEAWVMMELRGAINKVGEIARKGRKKRLLFAVSTQNLTDLDQAVTDGKLLDFVDTRIVMNLASTAATHAQGLLDLNEEEKETLMGLQPGHGMISTTDNRLYCKFEATRAETEKYFNTSAEK